MVVQARGARGNGTGSGSTAGDAAEDGGCSVRAAGEGARGGGAALLLVLAGVAALGVRRRRG